MSKWPETELELAKAFVWWLEDTDWTVYQEVQVSAYGSIADIVAVRDRIVWVIEVKKTCSLGLLSQAIHWVPFANYISIATPLGNRNTERNRYAVRTILDHHGIGHLTASHDLGKYYINEGPAPKLHRFKGRKYIIDSLKEEHKTFAEAGNSSGRRFTPFQGTCNLLTEYVQKHPGCAIKQAIDAINHHYASFNSARGALSKWIHHGSIPGVELRIEKRKSFLYPVKGDLK